MNENNEEKVLVERSKTRDRKPTVYRNRRMEIYVIDPAAETRDGPIELSETQVDRVMRLIDSRVKNLQDKGMKQELIDEWIEILVMLDI